MLVVYFLFTCICLEKMGQKNGGIADVFYPRAAGKGGAICTYRYLILFFEQMWYKLSQAAPPSEPLMIGSCRFVVLGLDAHGIEVFDHLLGTKHLVHTFCAAHHEEVVNLLVELVGTGEHAIISRL